MLLEFAAFCKTTFSCSWTGSRGSEVVKDLRHLLCFFFSLQLLLFSAENKSPPSFLTYFKIPAFPAIFSSFFLSSLSVFVRSSKLEAGLFGLFGLSSLLVRCTRLLPRQPGPELSTFVVASKFYPLSRSNFQPKVNLVNYFPAVCCQLWSRFC